MSLRSWWKRLWQPGPVESEFVCCAPSSGESLTITCANVTEVSYYAIHNGKRLPIITTDGCPLVQHVRPGYVHSMPHDLFPFVDIVAVGKVDDPSLSAWISVGGQVADVDLVWPETSVDDED